MTTAQSGSAGKASIKISLQETEGKFKKSAFPPGAVGLRETEGGKKAERKQRSDREGDKRK